MRIVLFIITLGIFSSFSSQAYAQKKTIWSVFFGDSQEETKGPDPSETLIAPFADDGVKDMGMFEGTPADIVSLDQAHTSETEIGRWLVKAVSEALTVTAAENSLSLQNKKKYFTSSGFKDFQKFLQKNNIQKVLESKRFDMRSYTMEEPLVLNTGEAGGRFRWLFEVPIMVSYMEAEGFDYKKQDPVNQNLLLTVQVGRVKEADNYYNILIDSFTGKSQKIK